MSSVPAEQQQGSAIGTIPLSYRTHQRTGKPPAYSIDCTQLKKLYTLLEQINREAAQTEAAQFKKPAEQSEEWFAGMKAHLISLFRVTVHLFSANGEIIIGHSLEDLDETKLPDNITKITYDNVPYFWLNLQREPNHKMQVILDFARPNLFDLGVNSSHPTTNESTITLKGENQTWVDGGYERITKFFQERKRSWAFLHNRNVYDIFLWLIIMPLLLFKLHRYDSWLLLQFAKVSAGFIWLMYLYIFGLTIILSRLIFHYARWVLPYSELAVSSHNVAIKHRIILFTLFSGIFYTLLQDLIISSVTLFFQQ